jgi:hypothetical protein
MRFGLLSLLGYFCLFSLSLAQSSSIAASNTLHGESSTCSPRTSIWAVYTSGSSTYFVQNGTDTRQASTAFSTETPVCDITTVWQTDYTSTVYSSRTSTLYLSNVFTMACESSGASGVCPMPSTITITEQASTGLPLPLSSTTSNQSDVRSDGSGSAVTVTSYLPGLACPTSNVTLIPSSQLSTYSTIATLSATVVSEISGSFTTSLIYGTAVCPINNASSPAHSSLFATSNPTMTLYSVSTQYINATCEVLSNSLPPITASIYLPGTSEVSLPAPASILSNSIRDKFTTTIYTQDTTCNLNSKDPVTAWNNFTTTIYANNVSNTPGFEATISGTRFTTIYEPDVTVTLSGSTVTACAYDDPGDDDDDDGQEGSSSAAASSATPTAPAPTVVANLGFENGTQNPLNSTKSDPNIVAQIATSNDSTPLTAYTGNSYL